MIAKGTTHDNGGKLATYLVTGKPGERADLWQLRGFAPDDIKDAFRSVHVIAEGTRCEKPLFHVQVRNPEGDYLTREQWERVADRIESKLGLTDQPRAIAFHQEETTGHEHMHIGWSRIDGETMTAKALPFFKLRLKEVSRELETELGLTPVRNEREGPVMAPKRDEDEQARRLGVDIREIRATIRESWERSDSGHSFAAALSHEGLVLAKGEKRDFIVVDHEGGMHALGKRILGNTAGEVRARMADLDREQLPTIEQAREQIAARREAVPQQTATHAGDLAWKEAISEAVNENTRPKVFESEPPVPPTTAKPEVDDSVTEIRHAYRNAGAGADLAAALDRNGMRLAVATTAEAERNRLYRGGEVVAVNQSGQVYQLNAPTLGASQNDTDRFLASIDRRDLAGIEATQEQIYLEGRLHMELTGVGTLSRDKVDLGANNAAPPPAREQPRASKGAADEPLPDWERMATDRVYRLQIEQKDRERRAVERQQKNQTQRRGREPDRY